LVVFDEASQIPVWDAVGALSRGAQAIVAGDSRQLPPTSFFKRVEEESEEDETALLGGVESLLDEFLAGGFPSQELSWHYRSRHESLISFSNQRYYQGRLLTFPSPATRDRAVSLVRVEGGLYDRAGSRTNLPEARAVAGHIAQSMRSPEYGARPHSIGVVTFNGQQQALIEDLLEEERARDPKLDKLFVAAQDEPVMVKNLENIQGDERDVIYFSVCFARDQAGKMSLNFGAINAAGGERRLNVAVTRARRSLLVYSSIDPEDIDLGRSQSEGLKDLKSFLEYAKRGTEGGPVQARAENLVSDFERSLAQALRSLGWTVEIPVGRSRAAVDLAVVSPQDPETFLAGILCDGLAYRDSRTARDRERLREEVLGSLGWDILRVWSLDYFNGREECLERVDRKLKQLQLKDGRKKSHRL
jgi:superfamily I DNA and/or RNA helicase